MGKTLGIISIKGGVGKTTVAASLAADLANHYKQRVLLIDGNHTTPHIGTHMNVGMPNKTLQDVLSGKSNSLAAVHKRFGVDVIPGDLIYSRKTNPFKLKNAIQKMNSNYDFVIIDSAPTLGDEAQAVLSASDGSFIVSTADEPTLHSSLAATRLIEKSNGKVYGIILNKLRDKTFEFGLKDFEKATGVPVVACLPDDKNVGRALFTQIPAPVFKKNSAFSNELSKLSSSLAGQKQDVSLIRRVLGLNMKSEEVNREVLRNEFYTSIFNN